PAFSIVPSPGMVITSVGVGSSNKASWTAAISLLSTTAIENVPSGALFFSGSASTAEKSAATALRFSRTTLLLFASSTTLGVVSETWRFILDWRLLTIQRFWRPQELEGLLRICPARYRMCPALQE